MILNVDPSAALPVYEQIRQQITLMAVSGVIDPGTRLPTIRQLANDLGLAKGTVAKAYSLLESTAVVESRGHRGTFVRELAADDAVDADLPALAEAAQAYAVVAHQHGVGWDDVVTELEQQWNLLG